MIELFTNPEKELLTNLSLFSDYLARQREAFRDSYIKYKIKTNREQATSAITTTNQAYFFDASIHDRQYEEKIQRTQKFANLAKLLLIADSGERKLTKDEIDMVATSDHPTISELYNKHKTDIIARSELGVVLFLKQKS